MAQSFKSYFFEQDADHPFQAWHANYLSAREAERKTRNPYAILGVAKPYKSDDLIKQAPGIYTTEVAIAEGSSSGTYAYGDQDEVPADDPAENAKWEFKINAQQEKLLIGQKAFLIDSSNGSFHERWFRLYIHVIIPAELEDQADAIGLSYWKFAEQYSKKFTHIKKFFVFQGLRQAVEMAQQEYSAPYPVKDDEDADAFWKRLIGNIDAPERQDMGGYKHGDDYWKK